MIIERFSEFVKRLEESKNERKVLVKKRKRTVEYKYPFSVGGGVPRDSGVDGGGAEG
jgi:hypothetical protein